MATVLYYLYAEDDETTTLICGGCIAEIETDADKNTIEQNVSIALRHHRAEHNGHQGNLLLIPSQEQQTKEIQYEGGKTTLGITGAG